MGYTQTSERGEREGTQDSNSSFHFCPLPIVNFFNFSINTSQLPGQMTPAPQHPCLPWQPRGKTTKRQSRGTIISSPDKIQLFEGHSRIIPMMGSFSFIKYSKIYVVRQTGNSELAIYSGTEDQSYSALFI